MNKNIISRPQKTKIKVVLKEEQLKHLINNLNSEKKQNRIFESENFQHRNSNGKFEFQFDRSIITKNSSSNNDYTYRFAFNKFKTFRDEFGITSEPCVFEADLDTFVSMLAEILEEYDSSNTNKNILDIKP